MKVVVIGCGWVGIKLIETLASAMDEITVVDKHGAALARLADTCSSCRTVVGHGADEKVLLQAGIQEADALAAVTDDDCINIMAAMMAKERFGVKKVVARIYNPELAEIFQKFGIEVICPTDLGVEQIREAISRV